VFFQKISEGKIRPQLKDGSYSFVVEDVSVRSRLESILKEKLGIAFEYHLNTETVTLQAKDFYSLFSEAIQEICSIPGIHNAALEKQINTLKKDDANKQFLEAVKDGVFTIIGVFTPLPVEKITNIIKKLIQTIEARK
jgi:hypothetical protein